MKKRLILWGGLAIGLLVAIGASFHEDTEALTHVTTARRVVALTFDDGPDIVTTPELLAILKEKRVRATFFVLGESVDRCPSLLAQEIEDGHEIAIHGYSHRRFSNLDAPRIEEEIDRVERSLARFSFDKPRLFRPPYGSCNETVFTVFKRKGYTVVIWDVDSKDWQNPSAETIIKRVESNVRPGSIVLFHDGKHPLPTPKAIPVIIEDLRREGYEFLTVSELLRISETDPGLEGTAFPLKRH